MQICWNTDVNAPCCPGEIVADDGQSILVQTDYDFPGAASTFGWNMREVQREGYEDNPCDHRGTDGTVDCPDCGVKASTFISAAYDWLMLNDGATVEDPGYFESDD